MSVDYFGRYFTSKCFDFPALIDDDFMAPIRLLFQNKHYISSAKLLLSMIDSIGYVEYGDAEKNPFMKWLSTYPNLSEVGVTGEELWELRNSLLHMSNLDSRSVAAGKTMRLTLYVGRLPPNVASETTETKYFSLQSLVVAVAEACGRWFATYNENRSKIDGFVQRYDLITSDNRMLWIDLSDGDGNA